MTAHRGALRGFFGAITATVLAGNVHAQEPATPPPETPATTPTPPPAAQPAPPAAEAAPQEAPKPVEAAPPAPPAAETVEPVAPTPADPGAVEKDEAPNPLSFMFFADANVGFQSAAHGTPAPWHRAYAWNTPAFTNNNGFALSFLGLDVNYDAGVFGATGSLRFGPSVPIFYAGDTSPLGINGITQAFLTIKPVDQLTIDVGQFGTIYGAEVAESWRNLNYSRGGLYYGFQPFWHTGVRAKYQLHDMLAITAMVVNGVNNIVDDDKSPSYGGQLTFTPVEEFSLSAGTLIAGNGTTDASGFDRFFDFVATVKVDRLTIIGNFDFNQNKDGIADGENSSFWGGSLAAGYSFTDWFGVAIRGEHLVDTNNRLYKFGMTTETINGEDVVTIPDQKVAVTTGTLTLDFRPFPSRKSLILRWDNRLERSDTEVFFDRDSAGTKTWFGSVVGLVVTTE